MKIFSGQVFQVKTDTSRLEFLGELRKFGFFSGVEFGYRDANQSIFYVREVGMLERLGKMFHSVFSKDIYRASGDALLHLSQKNMVLAGVLGRSVFDAQEKLVSARELNDRLSLGEKKFKRTEDSVLAVPSEGKMIITDALSAEFERAHLVNLSNELIEENFLEVCKDEFSKAIKASPWDTLVVKISPVFENDEPSDEAIKRLLKAIDEHQKCHPESRIMIATDGDHVLYERVLDLKVQHDAKKVLESNTSNFTAMDLFMIPLHGDAVVTLNPLDENKLIKTTTEFENIFVYATNQPQMIQSDFSIINEGTLNSTIENSDNKPISANKLMRWASEQTENSKFKEAFIQEGNDAADKFTLHAARFPAVDLPVKRLIVLKRLRANWGATHSNYKSSVEKVKNFYLKELRKERGRVVIESPFNRYACEGLRDAIAEMRRDKTGPREVIITFKDKFDGVRFFFPSTIEPSPTA